MCGKGDFQMYCNINGIELNYEIIGDGDPILMLNGNGVDLNSSKYCMEPIFEKVDGWKRIYIDQPGVGLTSSSDKINSGEDMLELVISFIDKIIPNQKFSLVGRSLGAYLAMGISIKRKGLIEGMLLICPPINIKKMDIDKDLYDVVNTDKEVEDRINIRVINEMEMSNKKTDRKFLEKIKNHLSFSFEVDSPEVYCEKPILIITGRQDATVGYRDQFKLLKWFPRATYIALDKSGHIPQIEQEVIFNILVKEWLVRVIGEWRLSD